MNKYIAILLLAFSLLFTSSASGQKWAGDWELRIEAKGTAFERRFAISPAQPFSGGEPSALIIIRKKGPDEPVELMVIATFDEQKREECDYDDWEVAIDSDEIPVSGFNTRPSNAVLTSFDPEIEEKLWRHIRKGSKLVVRVTQKCGGFFSGVKSHLLLTFSLRGSTAAYNFVIGNIDE